MAVFQLGRLEELNKGMAMDARNRKPVSEYLRNFWFDIDVHAPALRRAVCEVVGVDRCVVGTNFGGAYDNGDLTAGLGLSEADREKIRSGNAIELLKLQSLLAREPLAA
jgi:aminocarboxymuconate-semialdehyde decarboxylase